MLLVDDFFAGAFLAAVFLAGAFLAAVFFAAGGAFDVFFAVEPVELAVFFVAEPAVFFAVELAVFFVGEPAAFFAVEPAVFFADGVRADTAFLLGADFLDAAAFLPADDVPR